MERLKPKTGSLALYIILLFVAVGAMVYSCSKSAPVTPAQQTDDRQTVEVAIQISPIGVSTASDTLGGFYYDMIREIAKDNNLNVKIHGVTQISDALEGLNDGRYDVVIADIPITQELKSDYLFSDPIYADREVLVQLKDTLTGEPPITSLLQLRGDTVYLSAQSPFMTRIRNLSREIGDTIYIVQDADYGPEQMMLLTALGEIKNVVVNEHVANSVARDYPQLDTSLSLSFNQFQSWAFAPCDSVLCDSMNLWLDRYKTSPKFPLLIEKYFNEHPTIP